MIRVGRRPEVIKRRFNKAGKISPGDDSFEDHNGHFSTYAKYCGQGRVERP
jgi:hypothetical protein